MDRLKGGQNLCYGRIINQSARIGQIRFGYAVHPGNIPFYVNCHILFIGSIENGLKLLRLSGSSLDRGNQLLCLPARIRQ